MNTKCLVWLAVAAGVMGPKNARADEAVLLRHRFEKDRPLIYRSETVNEQVQTLGEKKFETNIQQADVTVRTLEKVDDDGNFHFKAENKRLSVKIKGATGDYTFDSTSTEREKGSLLGAALTPLYERMSGSALAVTATPRGKVTEVEGFEELVGDLLKDNPVGAQFAAGGSKQAARMSYQEMLEQFGEEAVKPGDKWEVPIEIELPKLGKAQGKRVYTYEGPDKVGDRETARIGLSVELAFDVNLEAGGAKITGRLSTSNASGTIQFDPRKGETVSKKSKYTISGTLAIDANGNTVNLQTEQTQSVTLELLDKLPE